jgi:hypothetical protein
MNSGMLSPMNPAIMQKMEQMTLMMLTLNPATTITTLQTQLTYPEAMLARIQQKRGSSRLPIFHPPGRSVVCDGVIADAKLRLLQAGVL